jgi:hypothetical protein
MFNYHMRRARATFCGRKIKKIAREWAGGTWWNDRCTHRARAARFRAQVQLNLAHDGFSFEEDLDTLTAAIRVHPS